MDCMQYQQLLQQRFDGEPVSDGTEFEQHLAGCPTCRELHAAARQLEEGLRLLPPVVPPHGLSERIAARVLEEQRRSRSTRRRVLTGLAVAASLVLAVVGYYRWNPSATPLTPDQPGPVAVVPPAGEAAPSLREGVAQARTMGADVARSVKESVEPLRMFWPEPLDTPGLPGAEAIQHTVDPAAQGVRELKQGVAAASEPVANGFRRFGDFVLRNLPPMDSDPKEGF
jgi:hypothetical protein